jgi:multidrug efflux pump
LPPGYAFEWSGTSFEERLAGAQAPILFALSLLVVFLALAALYESWSIPFAVILVVPLGILGAVLAVHLRGLPNDVFFKVGLIAIIGLSAKNAILIIEFAQATMTAWIRGRNAGACRLRLRPSSRPASPSSGRVAARDLHWRGVRSRHAEHGVIGSMIAATALIFSWCRCFRGGASSSPPGIGRKQDD